MSDYRVEFEACSPLWPAPASLTVKTSTLDADDLNRHLPVRLQRGWRKVLVAIARHTPLDAWDEISTDPGPGDCIASGTLSSRGRDTYRFRVVAR